MSKKGGKAQKEQSSYEVRDIVLAKVRGFPPWPGMIVDPDSVPPTVTKERPGSKKTTFYCVRFFPAGDYAWLVPKDISKLQTHEIEAYITEPYKRSGDLLTGYRIALDPRKWEDEREAAGAEAGEEEANAEIDQLDSEDEDKKLTKTKKRKRESDATLSSTKSKAKPKAKKGSTEPTGKKRATSLKGKKNGTKSKAMVESEDEGGHEDEDDAGPSKKASPPPSKKLKRDKDDEEQEVLMLKDPEAVKVRDWRHKLQKTFLSHKGLPKDEDMPALDQLFTTVENYDQINIQYLSFSKIGKVMRHIAALIPERVPRDDEFRFRERAKVLVDRWHQILGSNKPNGMENAANGDGGVEAHEAVAEGTAAIDLNGKAEESPVLPADGDETMGDITMSEA